MGILKNLNFCNGDLIGMPDPLHAGDEMLLYPANDCFSIFLDYSRELRRGKGTFHNTDNDTCGLHGQYGNYGHLG